MKRYTSVLAVLIAVIVGSTLFGCNQDGEINKEEEAAAARERAFQEEQEVKYYVAAEYRLNLAQAESSIISYVDQLTTFLLAHDNRTQWGLPEWKTYAQVLERLNDALVERDLKQYAYYTVLSNTALNQNDFNVWYDRTLASHPNPAEFIAEKLGRSVLLNN